MSGAAPSWGGGAPKCPKCGKSVYHAERAAGPNNTSWHRACFKCGDCNKWLDAQTGAEHEGQVFCKACYAKRYGPKGFGFAGGGGASGGRGCGTQLT